MRKYKDILFWVLIIAFIGVSMGFVADRSESIRCNKISVTIVDSLKNAFVHETDIVSMILAKQPKLLGTPHNDINTKKIENEIIKHPSVKNTQAYKTIDGKLNILVDQRNPIIRIYPKAARGFYIDQEGKFMPLSNKFSSHVLVANGEINLVVSIKNTPDVNTLDNKLISDLCSIAQFVSQNQFWNSQIEQIYVTKNGEFELVPRVGAQIIMLGNADNLEEKLRNLKAVYLEGFNKESWTKYKYINLKYNKQVICTKR